MQTAVIISFPEAKARLRPVRAEIEKAIDLWLLATEQAFYCLQCCQAYLDYIEACRLVPEAWLQETVAFWQAEFDRRTKQTEFWLDKRESR